MKMLIKDINDGRGVATKCKLVSRKIFSRLRTRSKVSVNLFTRKNCKNVNFVKKLPQKWRWRWNRKASSVWKSARALRRYNINGLRVFRLSKCFGVRRILSKVLMWNYSLNWKSLKFNQGQLTENRLDRILVTSMNARNITEARLKIQRGIVVVNGSVVFNYNVIIAANDVVQVRDNIQNSLSLLLQKRVSVVKARGLFV